MVTFTEKERKWILSDPGEIALGVDGSLQASNMFIESPSSLDLMLGMQKKPSWDCGCTDSYRTLETDCSQQIELNSKAPQQKRKRKPSWGGGFEDKERLSNLDSAENRSVNGERIGYPSISESVCNLQIQYVAQRNLWLETLRVQSPILKEFEQGTNQLLPPKKSNMNMDKNVTENRAQQCPRGTRHEAKGLNSVTSLVNARLKKRLKKLQASEFEENNHYREISENSQHLKVLENTAEKTVDLSIPSDATAEGSFTQNRLIDFLSAATFGNQASNGDVPSAPPSSKESTRCKRDFLTTQVKKNQVRASRVDWKEADDSLSAGSSERQSRRIEQHVREDLMKSATSSAKKEDVQRATHVEKLRPKNCSEKASLNGKGFTSSHTENCAKGYPKSAKSEPAVTPPTSSASKYDAEIGWASSTSKNFPRGYPKSIKSETAEIPQISSISTDEVGTGPPALTWENKRGYTKSKKSEAPNTPLICRGLRDEAGNLSNKKGSKDGQGGSKKGLEDPPANKRGNGMPDEEYKENHMNVGDAPVKEDCNLVKEGNEGNEGNARVRTHRLLKLFDKIHKQFKGGHKEVDVRNIIVECYPEYLVNGSDSVYGEVPGVEVGDTYKYRVEMDLVGLHHQFRRGIDVIPASKSTWCFPDNPKPVSVAACVVVAGGYADNRDAGDIIIYTGEGGNNHFQDKGPSKDQMLTFGNKALRHSRLLHLCVRVIRKFDNKPPAKPFYRYDGLYEVVDMRKDRSGGRRKKPLCQEEINDANHKGNKCKTVPLKPLVYKFLLVKKSAREKYKNVRNLWAYKPLCHAQVLNNK